MNKVQIIDDLKILLLSLGDNIDPWLSIIICSILFTLALLGTHPIRITDEKGLFSVCLIWVRRTTIIGFAFFIVFTPILTFLLSLMVFETSKFAYLLADECFNEIKSNWWVYLGCFFIPMLWRWAINRHFPTFISTLKRKYALRVSKDSLSDIRTEVSKIKTKVYEVEKHFKEQIALSIDLKEGVKDVEIKQLQQSLKLSDYVKSSRFISKEEAATIAQEENGEEFMDFIGYNPFQNSIDVFLNSEFVTLNSLEEIKTNLLQKNYIDEVRYDIDLVSLMNKNVKRISFWLIAISGVFAFIAMLLINSSIRLAVYSKRFIIKTMQMVGATKHFIRRPFIWKSIRLGLIGSLIAVAGLVVVAYYLDKNLPELQLLAQPTIFAVLCLSVVILGIVITWISTFFATQRFLNLKTEDLYY